MEYPKMTCPLNCGPVCLAFVTNNTIKYVEALMKWQHYDGKANEILENLQDSPWHHFEVIPKLGKQFKIRKCHDILNDKCQPNKTIILIHYNSREPIMAQHWVVYAGKDKDGVVLVHYLDGKPPRRMPDIEEQYSLGTPACAYEIVDSGGQTKLTWYQRFYVWMTNKFA